MTNRTWRRTSSATSNTSGSAATRYLRQSAGTAATARAP